MNNRKNTRLLLLLYFLISITIAEASTLEGCSYAHSNIIQHQVVFIDCTTGILIQDNRITGEYSVDTFTYAIDGNNWISPIGKEKGMCIADKPEVVQYTPCKIFPYVYRDGRPIKISPLGGSKALHRARPADLFEKSTHFCLGTLRMRLLSKSFLLCRDIERGDAIVLKLQNGEPIFTEMSDSLLRLNPHLSGYKTEKELLKAYSWGDLWYARKPYKHHCPTTLAGRTFEYNSAIKESIHFVDDSSCVIMQQYESPKGTIKYHCSYNILPNSLVVVQKKSTSHTGADINEFLNILKSISFSYRSDLSLVTAVDSVSCDTFLLCNDFMFSTKIYSRTESVYYRDAPMHLPTEKYILLSKAYVCNKKRASSVKIGTYYRRYFTPITFPPYKRNYIDVCKPPVI